MLHISSPQSTIIPLSMLSAVTITEAASKGSQLHNSLSFLHLPLELREMIYEKLFICPENIGTTGVRVKSVMKHARIWRSLSFARSCRQIWQESEHYFLTRNRFDFYEIRSFLTFLEAIGIKGRQLLTRVRYFHSVGHPFIVLRYLRSLVNVRELEIFARVRMPKNPGSWWVFPVNNVKSLLEKRAASCSEDYHVRTFLFTKDYWILEHYYDTLVEFGPISGVGEAAAQLDQAPPHTCQVVKRLLTDNLMRVKGEILGYITRNDLPDPEENEQYSQRHKYRMEEQELPMERVRVSGQARSCMEHKHRTRKYKRRYFRGHLAAHSLEGMM